MNSDVTSGASDDINALSDRVIGAAIEVHRTIGPGFLETIYEEALSIELTMREIPFVRQIPVKIDYKGHLVGEGRLDLLIEQRLDY